MRNVVDLLWLQKGWMLFRIETTLPSFLHPEETRNNGRRSRRRGISLRRNRFDRLEGILR